MDHTKLTQSLEDYLEMVHMLRLANGLARVKDIAAAVGYPNQLHFSRAFHQIIGASPRTWRNEHFSI